MAGRPWASLAELAVIDAPRPPNILVIYADDLGYGDLQCYNPERGRIPTPHLDRLAAEGMRFTDAHSSSGVCSPSRYTLLTGRYHWRSRLQRGIVGLWGPPLIPPDRLTIGGLAKRQGYQTACIGKWHLGWDWPIPDGKKKLFATTGYGGRKDLTASDAHRAAWREVFSQPIPGGPNAVGFDKYFGTDVPNWPPYCFIENDRTMGIPSEYADPRLFETNQASQQGPALPGWTLEPILPALGHRASAAIRQGAGSPNPFLIYLSLTSPHTPLAVNAEWKERSGLNRYADFVMETDAVVGRVLQALEESGAANHTLVLFTSDNGCAPYIGVEDLEAKGHYASGPLRGYKSDAWEGGHRVPFIVRWPEMVKPGSVCDQLVHQADLLATIADILGTELAGDEGEDSFSLLPLFQGSHQPVRDHAVSASMNGLPAVRLGPWKFIPGPGSGGWGKGGDPSQPVQLYDLAHDLGETRNLAAAQPQRVAQMQALLEKLITDGRSTPGEPQPNDVAVRRFPSPFRTASPPPELNLRLDAPITTWDEAVPLGNGTMGVLLWGEDNLLRLSLDRGDLWDERPSKRFTEVRDQFNWAAMQRMVAENDMARFHDVFDSNYDYNGPPTKLPAGRVEITLDPEQTVQAFELNLATAEGIAHFKEGTQARLFVDAAHLKAPVAMIRIPGKALKEVRLKSPDSVKKLGYEPPRTGKAEGLRWFEQPAANGFSYAICAGWKHVGHETLLAVTVATSAEGECPQTVAQNRVEAALASGYNRILRTHAQWWADFWAHSQIEIPEPHILRHYYLVRYFYGAASRRGAPPMPLQGVWSADAGTLPPWKGDYHNDLNTQMTYIAYRVSGDHNAGLCFLDYLWERLPTFRQFARDFYDAPGAAVPGVMSLAGQPLGGWGQYSLSPTMGAWNAHLFYLHWRHTADDTFLRERAYPFCREIGECLQALLKPDRNGVLVLPLSSSPEIFDNTRRAFLKPNTNYDLASIRMLFLALDEMASAVGKEAEAAEWRKLDRQLGDWHLASNGTLLLDASTPLPG
ncbi:MAG: sulfatase-like hydrolase/transferase, partial [Xanthomonadales bacterium]|nr:sulfatase-like hydrolase/transferase [Xanthomonadales bacterium]